MIALTAGVGLIVIVKVLIVPVQAFDVGVTEIVDVIGAAPELFAVKDAIFPFPFAASPMFGLLLVHENVVPASGPVKLIAAVELPLQNVWFGIVFTIGKGFTV